MYRFTVFYFFIFLWERFINKIKIYFKDSTKLIAERINLAENKLGFHLAQASDGDNLNSTFSRIYLASLQRKNCSFCFSNNSICTN